MIYLHKNFTTLHISKILLIWNSGSIIRNSNTIGTQFLRTVPMKQPAMYSYIAFHRYLYQIRFHTFSFVTRTHSSIHVHHQDETDLRQL